MSEEKYEVVNPFDLHDLYCIFLGEHFEKLLREMIKDNEWYLSVRFNIFTKGTVPKTLWEFRNVLESYSLIEKKGTVLKPGMGVGIKLKHLPMERHRVCQVDDGKLVLISTKNWKVWNPKGFPVGTTLEKLKSTAYYSEYYTLTEE